MRYYKISINDFVKSYNSLGCENSGSLIMSDKSQLNYIKIENIHVGAANILKQDCLSIGAELAIPKGVILAQDRYVDVILIATNKHLKVLSKKELSQPFGLKDLAKNLKSFIKPKQKTIKIMGVLNANKDSFFSKSRFDDSEAIYKIEEMIKNGADIIDIGAVSSRPGSVYVGEKIELQRIKPILDIIKRKKLYKKVIFSVDSFSPKVIKYAISCGVEIINDITGLSSDKVAKLVAKHNKKIVIMHKKGDTQTMQNKPYYDNVILEVEQFFKDKISKAKTFGITKDNIILDVGIGFGKRLEDNLSLIKNLEHFESLGCEILMGASRKSMIDMISPSIVDNRLAGTISIHLESIKNGASIVRVHDVYEHKQAIEVYKAINED
jgi:dihydropteroate synthase